jgi:cell division protease FtsH
MEIITFLFIIYFLFLILKLIVKYFFEENTFVEITPNSSHNSLYPEPEKKNINKKIDLNSVVGLESVKDEMKYYFDFINNSEKYKKWNVKLPKGILLVGPPGTGKTLLVKTLAKEIGIPVIHASGSEFVEMYVGVGASRIRKLFAKAKSHRKCVIFIDEIDAVGKRRGRDSNSEREQTLNQLLVEMDGFNEDTNIMVFAATNLVRELDSALTRSGRFDKKIYFDPPNKDERIELFKLYLSNEFVETIDYKFVAELTSGLTGADIANVANQSKINAIQNNNEKVTVDDVKKAIDEVMIGREKPERKMNSSELERVSRHEAGHALMSYLLKNCEPPVKVSILPRGEAALGFSQQKSDDKKLYTENYILSHICVLLGGRTAEKIFYNELSSGAHDDIEKVTNLIEHYYKTWGMSSKYGPLNFTKMELKDDKSITSSIIKGVKKLEKFTIEKLEKHKDQMILISDLLLEKETIDYTDIKNILDETLENSLEVSIY